MLKWKFSEHPGFSLLLVEEEEKGASTRKFVVSVQENLNLHEVEYRFPYILCIHII